MAHTAQKSVKLNVWVDGDIQLTIKSNRVGFQFFNPEEGYVYYSMPINDLRKVIHKDFNHESSLSEPNFSADQQE